MDALTIIFVAMAAILFGYGGYVLGNYYPMVKRKQKSESFELVEQDIQKNNLSEDAGVIDLDGDIKPDAEVRKRALPKMMNPAETIQIWYDAESRKIMTEIDGQLIDLDGEVDEEKKQKLTWLLIDLQEKVGLVGNVKKQIKDSENYEEQVQDPINTRFNPIRSFVNYLQADVPAIEDKNDSFAEQINSILQEQLVETSLADKGISVVDFPDKGLIFMIGLELYEDIENIPDKKIQTAIKSAVKTWEDNLGKTD